MNSTPSTAFDSLFLHSTMSFSERPSVEALTSFLEANPAVEFLRYRWLDIGNVTRLIVVTKEHALSLGNRPLKVSCVTFGMLPYDSFNLSRFEPAGYDELHSDWSGLRLCTYLRDGKTHATVMCFVKEQSRNFPAWSRDPRSVLDRALRWAKNNFELNFLVGFEVEFVLVDKMNCEASQPVELLNQVYGAAALRDD